MDAILGFIGALIQFAIFILLVLAVMAIWSYNTLRKLAESVKEAESNIGVAVRKKVSLVNQLLEVAGTYMDRESLVMLKVSQDSVTSSMQQTYQQSGTVLSAIQGVAQRFPDLQASQQYTNLATAISRSETDLQNARLICNAAIKAYNSTRSGLPHTLYASAIGFQPAQYLELDNAELLDAGVQKRIISDDGDRLNQLLGMAGTRVLDVTKAVASQGKLLAERATRQGQSEGAAEFSAAPREYHYLDASKTPKGPVSRSELDALFVSGAIAAETDVLEAGSRAWTKYSNLGQPLV
jgi:LemA protein